MKKTPAWSEYFTADVLQTISPISPIDNITRDWAWGGSTGKGIKVAVIDSGVNAEHPALSGRVNGYVSIVENVEGIICDTSPHQDDCGHGTACAGISFAV